MGYTVHACTWRVIISVNENRFRERIQVQCWNCLDICLATFAFIQNSGVLRFNSKKQGGYNVRDGNMVKSRALPDAGTLLFKNWGPYRKTLLIVGQNETHNTRHTVRDKTQFF